MAGISLPDVASLVSSVLTIVQQIQQIVTGSATAQQVDAMMFRLGELQQTLGHADQQATSANNASTQANSNIVAARLDIAKLFALVSASNHVDSVTQQVVVNLPTTPPAGYGGGSGSAADVWNYTVGGDIRTTGYWMAQLGHWINTNNAAEAWIPVGTSGILAFVGIWSQLPTDVNPDSVAHPDITDILSTETLGEWLNRTSGVTWARDTNSHFYHYPYSHPSFSAFVDVYCLVSDPQFEAWKIAAPPPPVLNTAPVWPGIANVVLGDPITIAESMDELVDCDGLILQIDNSATNPIKYNYGDHFAWLKIGALAFISDNGSLEHIQALSFDQQVYCPKSMVTAKGFVLKTTNTVSGTVRPWLRA
jgi:hypothetical protein